MCQRALGLVLNAVVLWNTRYMDLALDQLKDRGVEVQAADVARPRRSASATSTFWVATPSPCLSRSGLRPLRNAEAADDEEDEAVA